MNEMILETKGVSLHFDGREVLRDVNLQVRKSECLVLIGPSGQGKTVLLKILAGLIVPQQGEVLVKSKDWRELRGAERLATLKDMGMLFQKNALFDSLTCGENIAFPLRETTPFSESEIAEKVEYYLDSVGLAHTKSLYPDEISGGMQKRLGIARALALRPGIIFYDDPTAGLDPITSRKIVELILKLKAENQSTVVAITNDMNRAFQMGDRIAMVVDSQLIISGSPAETKAYKDPRVQQFIHGSLEGPLSSDMVSS